jgi:hypothetical protein
LTAIAKIALFAFFQVLFNVSRLNWVQLAINERVNQFKYSLTIQLGTSAWDWMRIYL